MSSVGWPDPSFDEVWKGRGHWFNLPLACSQVLRALRSALPDRGYTSHVIGYSAHAVLSAAVKAARGDAGLTASGTKKRRKKGSKAEAKKGVEDGKEAATKKRKGADGGRAGSAAAVAAASGGVGESSAEEEGGKEDEEDWGSSEGSQPSGILDDSLELVLPLIDNELFGERFLGGSLLG